MDPASIDVNVHPAKMEIRLHKGQLLYENLSTTVSEALQRIELIPEVRLTDPESGKTKKIKAPEPFEINRKKQDNDRDVPESLLVTEEKNTDEGFVPGLLCDEDTPYQTKPSDTPQTPNVKDFLNRISLNRIIGETGNDREARCEKVHSNVIKADQHILVEKPTQLNLFEEKLLSVNAKDEYRILGQIFDTYWLIAFHDKLFIMDQHAAHEKVKYERLYKELQNKEVSSQMLNPPVILTLTGKEEQLLKEQMQAFEELGFEIEEFGSGSYAIRSMPSDLYGCSEKELFTDILDELGENPMKGSPEVVLNKLAFMACKAAVKGNNRLSLEEAESLIDELLTLENPYHCPHGRPTIISMSKYEIEKKFKRIV
jgi:DNA mismatch repair protein MutL